jgi:dihydroorotase
MADLVVIDPKVNWKLDKSDVVSKSTNSPFLSRSFQGRAVMTLVNGLIKYEVSKWES